MERGETCLSVSVVWFGELLVLQGRDRLGDVPGLRGKEGRGGRDYLTYEPRTYLPALGSYITKLTAAAFAFLQLTQPWADIINIGRDIVILTSNLIIYEYNTMTEKTNLLVYRYVLPAILTYARAHAFFRHGTCQGTLSFFHPLVMGSGLPPPGPEWTGAGDTTTAAR
ncbi:hypothetical protein LY76DRAFT_610351 [Colletotrichum caudatum]|nr:hypothetical protein LY76DRAFT_610351 [Colletotrichum caudatum]